ncbi:MAG: hypothetical protein ACKN9W_02140 [Methylococcus sp.]
MLPSDHPLARVGALLLALSATAALAEPRIVIGPTEAEAEPEVVETISGLSYDQLKRLRELRKWLEQRQMIREQIRLSDPRNRERPGQSSLFADRQLFAPLGQRYSGKLPEPPSGERGTLKLPPLPRFEREDPAGAAESMADPSAEAREASAPRPGVTHITPPPNPKARDPVQIEYELNP